MPFHGDQVDDRSLPITVGGVSWNLNTAYHKPDDCTAAGLARQPATALMGTTTFVLVTSSPVTLGYGSAAEGGYKWDVASFDSPASMPRTLGVELEGAVDLAVSPDGRSVAVAMTGYQPGIVLIDVATGSQRRLIEGTDVRQLSFSPDGTRLVYNANLRHLSFVPVM